METRVDMIRMLSERMVLINNKIYMISNESGILFSIDLITEQIELENCFDEDNFYYSRLFGDIKYYKDTILLIPANSKFLYVLDKDIKLQKKIEINSKFGYEKYMSSQIIDDKLYLFGHGIFDSVIVDLNTFSIKENARFSEELFFSSLLENNVIYLPSCKNNTLYLYDTAEDNLGIVKIGDRPFNGIYLCDEYIYLAPRNSNKVCIYNKNSTEIHEIEIPFCNSVGIFVINGEIYVPSDQMGKSLIIHKDETISYWQINNSFTVGYDTKEKYFLMDSKGVLHIIDKKTGDERKINVNIPDEKMSEFLKNKGIVRKQCTRETNINNLRDFIRTI